MPVTLTKLLTSGTITVVDNVLVELEERGTIKENMKYIKDVIRLGGAIGGALYNYFMARPGALDDEITESLTYSCLPLAGHSIRNLIKEAMAKAKATSTATYTAPRRVSTPSSAGYVRSPSPTARAVSF